MYERSIISICGDELKKLAEGFSNDEELFFSACLSNGLDPNKTDLETVLAIIKYDIFKAKMNGQH